MLFTISTGIVLRTICYLLSIYIIYCKFKHIHYLMRTAIVCQSSFFLGGGYSQSVSELFEDHLPSDAHCDRLSICISTSSGHQINLYVRH